MSKEKELNDLFNSLCDGIDICCSAICMGAYVEENRKRNGEYQRRIEEVRAEAEALGITLQRRR